MPFGETQSFGTCVMIRGASIRCYLVPRSLLQITNKFKRPLSDPPFPPTVSVHACDHTILPWGGSKQTQSTWEVCLKAAADGGWVVIQDWEGAADCISLIMDGIRRRSAVRTASAAAAEGQKKLLREQQIAGKTATTSTTQPTRDGPINGSPFPQGTPSNGAALAAQQVGGPVGTAVVLAAAHSDNVARRVAIPGVAKKEKASVSRMSPEHPLGKSLSAGGGGTMGTRVQPAAAAALRWGTRVAQLQFCERFNFARALRDRWTYALNILTTGLDETRYEHRSSIKPRMMAWVGCLNIRPENYIPHHHSLLCCPSLAGANERPTVDR